MKRRGPFKNDTSPSLSKEKGIQGVSYKVKKETLLVEFTGKQELEVYSRLQHAVDEEWKIHQYTQLKSYRHYPVQGIGNPNPRDFY